MNESRTYYTVAKIDVNSWSLDSDGKEWPVIHDMCGHKHRSLKAAYQCQRKLLNYNRQTDMWSAYWHNSKILHSDGSYLNQDEFYLLEDIRLEYPAICVYR